ncbi:hypothetical protein FACS1894170_05240 [Planctomycetales bacterium]|nr:hypothetical protein FACS1894170_05240 [Planctomycetales bacterium]
MDNRTKRRVFLGIVIGLLVAGPFVISLFREPTHVEARRIPPKILKLEPANGKSNVKPGRTELRVTFDRDMSDGMMWGFSDEGEVAPAIVGTMMWENKRTFLVVANLEPGTQYGVWLNKEDGATKMVAFRNEGDVPLKAFHWTFKTSGEKVIKPAPKVAELKPENGATVEAGEAELRVTFDQDMKSVAAWCGADDAPFPEYGDNKPHWLDKRTCVFNVKLEPGKNYAVWLNKSSQYPLSQYGHFASEVGVPLEDFHWTFKTSPK